MNPFAPRARRDAGKLEGKKPGDLTDRWFALNEQGVIEEQSGGFEVLDAYDTNTNAYIDAGTSLEGKGRMLRGDEPSGHSLRKPRQPNPYGGT